MSATERFAQSALILLGTGAALLGCGSSGERGITRTTAVRAPAPSEPAQRQPEIVQQSRRARPTPSSSARPSAPTLDAGFAKRLSLITADLQDNQANSDVLAAIKAPGVGAYRRAASALAGYLPKLDAYFSQTRQLDPPPRCAPARSALIRVELGTRSMFVHAIPLLRAMRRAQLSGEILREEVTLTASLQHLHSDLSPTGRGHSCSASVLPASRGPAPSANRRASPPRRGLAHSGA